MRSVKEHKIVFWDFDGVIKESVDIKTQAFVKLFEPYGEVVMQKVKEHHEANGGMSRYKKIPLYLEWVDETCTSGRLNELSNAFSNIAFQGVVNSAWVPGAEKYLRDNTYNQVFVLVSATPEKELKSILKSLNLAAVFSAVYGAPVNKADAIRDVLDHSKTDAANCLMIGDAIADMEAAQVNNVPFLLRKHNSNRHIFINYNGNAVNDLTEI